MKSPYKASSRPKIIPVFTHREQPADDHKPQPDDNARRGHRHVNRGIDENCLACGQPLILSYEKTLKHPPLTG